MSKKIVIAMSGGVDSSVAAAILKEQGNEVIGVSLKLWDYSFDTDGRSGTCCSLDDISDARRVAEKIGIPFYALNMEKEFKEEVVDHFVDEYMRARTPIPCTLCNQKLKFDHLLKKAELYGFDFVATGHYASIYRHESGRLTVKRGKDSTRDQSYFLFNLSQEQIARVMFPLAEFEKTEVRKIAESLGLGVAGKSESHEICFIPDNDYSRFIAGRVNGDSFRPGNIVDSEGNILGKHKGYPGYTIGPRKGLDLGGLSGRRYVTAINPEKNEITVGEKSDLYAVEFFVDGMNWYLEPEGPFDAEAQIRYRHTAVPARIEPQGKSRARVLMEVPQTAITPGQATVFYRDDYIVGGGWIEWTMFFKLP